MDVVIRRFDVFLTKLDPAVGSEMRKTRPCVVVTPDEMNRNLRTVIVAPLTSSARNYPFRVDCSLAGRPGGVALDQMRCVDHGRLVKPLGRLDASTAQAMKATLVRMFG